MSRASRGQARLSDRAARDFFLPFGVVGQGLAACTQKVQSGSKNRAAAPNCAEPFAINPRYCSMGRLRPEERRIAPSNLRTPRDLSWHSLRASPFLPTGAARGAADTCLLDALRAAELRRARAPRGNKDPDSCAWCDATPSVCLLRASPRSTLRAPLPFPLAPRRQSSGIGITTARLHVVRR